MGRDSDGVVERFARTKLPGKNFFGLGKVKEEILGEELVGFVDVHELDLMDRSFAFLGGTVVVAEVAGIVFGDGNVDEGHLTDGAVAATGFDEDGGEGFDGNPLAIELEEAFAFENEVNFGGLLVIVAGGLVFDLEEMDGGGGVGEVGEATLGSATAAIDLGEFVELNLVIAALRHGKKSDGLVATSIKNGWVSSRDKKSTEAGKAWCFLKMFSFETASSRWRR